MSSYNQGPTFRPISNIPVSLRTSVIAVDNNGIIKDSFEESRKIIGIFDTTGRSIHSIATANSLIEIPKDFLLQNNTLSLYCDNTSNLQVISELQEDAKKTRESIFHIVSDQIKNLINPVKGFNNLTIENIKEAHSILKELLIPDEYRSLTIELNEALNGIKHQAERLQEESVGKETVNDLMDKILEFEKKFKRSQVICNYELAKHVLELHDESIENLDIVDKRNQLLLKTIDIMLEYTQIPATKHNLKNNPIDLNMEMNLLVDNHRAKALEKGLEFDLNISDDIPQQIYGNKLCLESSLNHIIDNAIKFSNSGKVRLNILNERYDEKEVLLRFSVSDDGIGLSRDDIENIFSPFFQSGSLINRVYDGLGLGLSISKKCVELLGYKIEVESILGKGSTFSFLMPFYRIH